MFRLDDIRILIIATIGMFLLSFTAEAANCDKHPIYCKIKSLKPKMPYKRAMRLSNLMCKSARKHKVKNVIRSVAIAMQETSLRNVDRKQTIIVFDKKCIEGKCEETFRYVRGSSDISIFQFHTLTIKRYNMDAVKLKNNLEYAVDKHFMLMKKKLKYCKHLGDEAWTCYHSRTSKFRKRYKEDVERYF